jgi:hypothetical protein
MKSIIIIIIIIHVSIQSGAGVRAGGQTCAWHENVCLVAQAWCRRQRVHVYGMRMHLCGTSVAAMCWGLLYAVRHRKTIR